jgi:hypothetical protein
MEKSVYSGLDTAAKVELIKKEAMRGNSLVSFADVKIVDAAKLPELMPDVTGVTLPVGVPIEILEVIEATAKRPDGTNAGTGPGYYFVCNVPNMAGLTRIPCNQLVQPFPTDMASFKTGGTSDKVIGQIEAAIEADIYKPTGSMGQDAAALVGKTIKIHKIFKNVKKFQAASTRPGSTWNKDGVLNLTLTFLEKVN